MDTVFKNESAPVATGSKGGLWQRLKQMNRLFLGLVVVPTALATLYFGVIASDIYVSESRFVVRSPQRQNQANGLGALLQGTGLSRAQDDTYSVIDYIESRDALGELNRDNAILDAYGHRGDFIRRFWREIDGSFEALWRYYVRNVVTVEFNPTSSIATLEVRAFTAAESTRINEALLAMSERLVNRMNERANIDAVALAGKEMEIAAGKAKDAAAALAAYRRSNVVFDPDRQSALQLQQVNALEIQRFNIQAQLAQIQAVAPNSPQVTALKSSIAEIEKQIKGTAGEVTSGKGSLSEKAAAYARLQLDVQLADRQLASATVALEGARLEAQRKQLYLERLVQPNAPDIAVEPKRLRSIFVVFILGLIVWGVVSLLIAGVREHND